MNITLTTNAEAGLWHSAKPMQWALWIATVCFLKFAGSRTNLPPKSSRSAGRRKWNPSKQMHFEYIAFAKTGSTSLRAILGSRARAHGWAQHTPRGQNQICHYFKAGDCKDLPYGYVVQTTEKMAREFCHHRKACATFTLLREVTSRMLSDWEYFCLACREGRSKCKSHNTSNAGLRRDDTGFPLETPRLTCPNMSLVDYAVYIGNAYTFALSEARPPAVTNVNRETFLSALRATIRDVVAGNLTLLFTDEMSKSTVISDLFAFLFKERPPPIAERPASVPRRNTNHQARDAALTCDQQLHLLRALKWDFLLYTHIRFFAGKPFSPPINTNCPIPEVRQLITEPRSFDAASFLGVL